MKYFEYIFWASIISSFIPFIYALFSLNWIRKGYALIIFFLLFNGFEDLVMTVMALNGINNWWFIYITFPVHFYFVYRIFYELEPVFKREMFIVSLVITLQLIILHTIYLINGEMGTIGLLLGAIMLAVFALRILLSDQIISKPNYLFTAAILFYFLIGSISFYLLNVFKQLYPFPYLINCAASIISNLLFAASLWTLRRS